MLKLTTEGAIVTRTRAAGPDMLAVLDLPMVGAMDVGEKVAARDFSRLGSAVACQTGCVQYYLGFIAYILQ